jgi:hypothetical protein
VSAKDYLTDRGALLAKLEHHCEHAGRWGVEGYDVVRVRPNVWRIEGSSVGQPESFTSFTAALYWIANERSHLTEPPPSDS